MPSRLSRRLSALLCAGLLALTVLVGGPAKLAFDPQPTPPGGPAKLAFDPQPIPPGGPAKLAFDPEPIPPGAKYS